MSWASLSAYRSLGVELSEYLPRILAKMSEDLTVDVDSVTDVDVVAPTYRQREATDGSDQSFCGYEIISTAKELLAADGKDKVEEVALYLEELRVRERGGLWCVCV